MTEWVEIAKDYQALRYWAHKGLRAAALDEDVILPPDVAAQLTLLLEIEDMVAAGTYQTQLLLAHEARGLELLKQVRHELQQSLTRCPNCGRLSSSEVACSRCKQFMPAQSKGAAA